MRRLINSQRFYYLYYLGFSAEAAGVVRIAELRIAELRFGRKRW